MKLEPIDPGRRIRRRYTRRALAVAVALGAVAPGACATRGEPAPDRGACERLRDHVVEVRLAGVADDRDAHRAAAVQALGADFVPGCIARTSRAELDCALAATTLPTLHACTPAR